MAEDRLDETESDVVTGLDVVDGVLTWNRYDGSKGTYAGPTGPTGVTGATGPAGATGPTGPTVLSLLPTADPLVAGQLWNNAGDIMLSAGP